MYELHLWYPREELENVSLERPRERGPSAIRDIQEDRARDMEDRSGTSRVASMSVGAASALCLDDPTPLARPGGPYAAYTLAEPLNDSEIHARFAELVARASNLVFASHYTFDDTMITEAYLAAARRGVSVQLVMDGQQSNTSSSKTQNARIVDLLHAGVVMKIALSHKGRNMCHQKCLVVRWSNGFG